MSSKIVVFVATQIKCAGNSKYYVNYVSPTYGEGNVPNCTRRRFRVSFGIATRANWHFVILYILILLRITKIMSGNIKGKHGRWYFIFTFEYARANLIKSKAIIQKHNIRSALLASRRFPFVAN